MRYGNANTEPLLGAGVDGFGVEGFDIAGLMALSESLADNAGDGSVECE